MIVVVIKEGLGNQMFQYAAGRALAHKLGTTLKMDISHFEENKDRRYSLSHFDIHEQFVKSWEKILLRIKNKCSKLFKTGDTPSRIYWYHEKGLSFKPDFFQLPNNTYVEGYWQSEKNFISIEEIIRQEFIVKDEPGEMNRQSLEKISQVNSVAIHIRRGDYLSNLNVNAIHGICSVSYYDEAISYISGKVHDPHFFIFSDDMIWVKEHFPIPGFPVFYMDFNQNSSHEDLRLMYSCKHNIIANSSFSWWGAWLNQNPGKIVIAPIKWFNSKYTNPDIVPDNWIRM